MQSRPPAAGRDHRSAFEKDGAHRGENTSVDGAARTCHRWLSPYLGRGNEQEPGRGQAWTSRFAEKEPCSSCLSEKEIQAFVGDFRSHGPPYTANGGRPDYALSAAGNVTVLI